MSRNTAIVQICCEDSQGIVALVTSFIDAHNGNILYLDQHTAIDEGRFFMRVEWDMDKFSLQADEVRPELLKCLEKKHDVALNVYFSSKKLNVAIFVSKLSHCLYDILGRHQSGELAVNIPLIISNHETLRPIAEQFGIPFYYFPITKENKLEQEEKEIELLKKFDVGMIVLARYMQVVTDGLIKLFPNNIINIHHSSLPAFPGAKPYHSAYKKGVKIMGATGHYVTAELDEGPIITQDVTSIDFKDHIQDLVRKGKDLEKIVLSKAIYLHIRRRVLVYNHKTIVFN